METPQDWNRIVVQALGYTDLHGMARAATLLKLATSDIWKKCGAEARRLYGKEIKESLIGLRKHWNQGVEVSGAAIKDAIAKVLIDHQVYPWPELIHLLSEGKNPYQTRSLIPDARGDQADPLKPE